MSIKLEIPLEDRARYLTFDLPDAYQGFRMGSIGKHSYIGEVTFYYNFGHHCEITNLQIGRHCAMGLEIKMLFNRMHDHMSITTSSAPCLLDRPWVTKRLGQIIIGHDVWVGNSVIFMPDIRVGNGAIVAVGSVVVNDVPAYSIVAGNPARILRYRYTQEQIQKLQQIRWWTWDDEKIEANRHFFSRPITEFIEEFWSPPKARPEKKERAETTKLLFFADFDDPYPIWKKVIKEYLATFTSKDPIILSLLLSDEGYSTELAHVEKFISSIKEKLEAPQGEYAEISLITSSPELNENFFADTDFFIANRSSSTMDCIQLCEDYAVKLLSGVDIPIFSRKQILGRKA